MAGPITNASVCAITDGLIARHLPSASSARTDCHQRPPWCWPGGEVTIMNSSLLSADRNTHIRILVVALLAGAILVAVGLSARIANTELAEAPADVPVLKAGKPAAFATSDQATTP